MNDCGKTLKIMGNKSCIAERTGKQKDKKPMTSYQDALSMGKVQVLRLASLNRKGDIVVQSTNVQINDETFQNVGICSYTWGFDRTRWYDDETGLEWEIADRCEEMCRAALKFYPRVWIDGLCMIQAWSEHIAENMNIMGRLYWHGNVVPEMVLDRMALEYPLRGWVQQEISFTNLQYSITPLQKWFDANEDIIVPFSKYIQQKHEKGKGGEGTTIPFPNVELDIDAFDSAVSNSIPYLNVLSRATEGRSSDEARLLQAEIAKLLSQLQAAAFMSGRFMQETLVDLLSLDLPLTGKLKREENPKGLINGALQSYRSGFFRYNTDRLEAAFNLAAYVSNPEQPDVSQFLYSIEKDYKPHQRAALTINGNPGRWCTGLGPIISLQTIAWPNSFEGVLRANGDFEDCTSREEIDLFVSIIYGCDQKYICDNYDYVVGYKRIDEDDIHSCHFGIKKKGKIDTPNCRVRGLISANVPIDGNKKNDEYYASYGHIVNEHLKMELGVRAISLLNSSWYVKSRNDPSMVFPADSQTLRMLDLRFAPPFGKFTSPMKVAILFFLNALGCATGAARDSTMVKSSEIFDMDWGDEDIHHVDL